MKLNIIFTVLSIFCSLTCFSQSTTVYFIRKIIPNEIFNHPSQYSKEINIHSVGVEIFKSKLGVKTDSTFIMANDFRIWQDSVFFEIKIPNSYYSNSSTITFNPIFYLNKAQNKGDLPKAISGKEQTISQIKLKIKSDPIGAKVYLVPKFIWDINPNLAKFDGQKLFPYLISEGVTTVTTYVQEYVYIVVYNYKGRYSITHTAPNHLHILDSVFQKVN